MSGEKKQIGKRENGRKNTRGKKKGGQKVGGRKGGVIGLYTNRAGGPTLVEGNEENRISGKRKTARGGEDGD